MKPVPYLLPLVLALSAQAQEAPSFDCSKATGSAQELICADPDLARLDRLLSDRFASALEVAQDLDIGAEAAINDLRAVQRGWIKGRDDCWKADDLRACVERAYLTREGELVARWMLDEPTGTAVWTCDANPANELVTTFYATELPSVRFERGDSVSTGSLSRTGSGSRYEGAFGQSLWIKGDEATYREPDPNGETYNCVVTEER